MRRRKIKLTGRTTEHTLLTTMKNAFTRNTGLFLMAAVLWAFTTTGFSADKVKVGPRKSSTEKSSASTEVNVVYENSKLNTVNSSGTVKPVNQPVIEVVTATNTIAATETESVFFLNSGTEFVSTLPAPAAGLHFTFIVTAAPSGASYTIVTTTSANIIKGVQVTAEDAAGSGDSGTADDTITLVDGQAVAGDKIECWSDGTSWFVYATSKVKAGVTFTQAS